MLLKVQLLFLLLISSILSLEAQTSRDTLDSYLDEIDIVELRPQREIIPYESKPIVCSVEEMSNYQGGENALRKYISRNIRQVEDSKEGRVVVRFTINRDGFLENASIVRGLSKEADKEALRVVNSIPKRWTPAKQNGRTFADVYFIPIYFKNLAND